MAINCHLEIYHYHHVSDGYNSKRLLLYMVLYHKQCCKIMREINSYVNLNAASIGIK